MTDYSKSVARQSGATTIHEHRIAVAFQAGQRDAEQHWPADATRWNYDGPYADAYHEGYHQPRIRPCPECNGTGTLTQK